MAYFDKKTRKAFGINLRAVMVRRGFSDDDVERQMGIGRRQLYAYKYGRTIPRASRLRRFCAVLGVPLEQLIPNYKKCKVAQNPKNTRKKTRRKSGNVVQKTGAALGKYKTPYSMSDILATCVLFVGFALATVVFSLAYFAEK